MSLLICSISWDILRGPAEESGRAVVSLHAREGGREVEVLPKEPRGVDMSEEDTLKLSELPYGRHG